VAMGVGPTDQGAASQSRDAWVAGLGQRYNNWRRRRQGRRHAQATYAAIVDAGFAVGPVGRGRRPISGAAVAKNNAAGLRNGLGSDLRGAEACNEARKRDRVSRDQRHDAARQRRPRPRPLM